MSDPVCHVCKLPYDVGTKRCANCGAALQGSGGGSLTSQDLVALVPKASRSMPLIVMGALAAVGAIGAVVLARRPAQDPPMTEVAQQEPVVAAEQAEAREMPSPVVPEPPAEPPVVPTVEQPTEVPPSTDSVTLQFLASAVSVKGRGVRKGAKCQVNVHVRGADIEDVDVSCGDKVLYDSRTPLNGMASIGGDLFERAKRDAWIYRVVYSDTGMRSSRNQIRLNSTTKQATVFSESDEVFAVDLRVDEFSLPRKGEPLMGTQASEATMKASVLFAAQTGTPPKVPRDKCIVQSQFVETTSEGARCKTLLSCGPTTFYGKGQTGFGPCEIANGQIVSFIDSEETHEDGDPALDFASQTVTVRDSPGKVPFSLEFSVPPEE